MPKKPGHKKAAPEWGGTDVEHMFLSANLQVLALCRQHAAFSKEAADLLHISYQTLAKRTQSGEFVAYRVGTRVLYKRAELIAALTPTNRYTVPGNKRGPKPKLRAAA